MGIFIIFTECFFNEKKKNSTVKSKQGESQP